MGLLYYTVTGTGGSRSHLWALIRVLLSHPNASARDLACRLSQGQTSYVSASIQVLLHERLCALPHAPLLLCSALCRMCMPLWMH